MKTLSYRSVPKVSALPTPSGAFEGVIVELSTDGKPYWCDGVTWTDMTAGGGGGGAALAVKEEGTTLTAGAVSINFTGPSVVASAVGNDVTITSTAASLGFSIAADVFGLNFI